MGQTATEETTKQSYIPIQIPKSRKNSKVDLRQAVDLRCNHHLSYTEIAKLQGVTKQAIHERIKAILPIPENQVFQDHRADILSNLQLKLLYNLDDSKIKDMSGQQIVTSAAILYDKERLERDKSTANVATLTADIAKLKGLG
jgi:hypothetical protein